MNKAVLNWVWDSGSQYSSEYQAVLTQATSLGYTLPSDAIKTKGDNLIRALKTAGIWSSLDRFGVFKTDGDVNFALIDWVNPALSCTRVASCTFTSNVGFQGNAINTMYLNTGFSAKLEGVNFQLNSCSVFAYCPDAYATPGVIYGANDLTNSNYIQLDPNNAGSAIFFMESTSFGDNLAGADTSAGLWMSQRTAAATSKLFRNGTLFGNGSRTSVDRPTSDMYLLGRNNNGTFANACDQNVNIGMWGAGASLSGLESALDAAWDSYIA